MSWDIGLEIDTGGEQPASIGGSFNYTHNTNQMLRDVGFLREESWSFWEGKMSADFCAELDQAISKLEATPEKFEAMNPPNNWGDYKGLLRTLRRVLQAFKCHPNARVWVSA